MQNLKFKIILLSITILVLPFFISNYSLTLAQTPAFDFSLTNDGDKILSAGGRVTGTITVTNVVSGSTPRAVNLSSLFWAKVTNAASWVGRVGHISLTFGNRMWVMGGADNNGVKLGDVWSSLDGVNWTQVQAAAPWGNHISLSAVVFNNRMWVLRWYANYPGGTTYQDIWSSADGVSWTQVIASVPWGNSGPISVWGDRMWVVQINSLWSSTDGANWSQVAASIPWSSYDTLSPLLNFNNRMWVIGGRFTRIPSTTIFTAWSSADGVSWTQAGTLTLGGGVRWILNSLVFNNKMWVMVSGSAISSSDGTTWTQTITPGEGRDSYAALVFNNAMWIFGGRRDFTTYNDVWSTPSFSQTSCTPNPTCSITQTITSIPITTQTPVEITGSDGTNQHTTRFLLLPSTPSPPTVTTNAPTSLTSSNLTRTATVTLSGSTTRTVSTIGWFRYSLADPGNCDDTFGTRVPLTGGVPLGFDTTPATFSQTISGLPTETIYYYCALAKNIGGTAQGSIAAFQTPPVCSGNIALTLAPSTTPSLGPVIPTASGLRACGLQINFREGSCLSGIEPLAVSTCTSDNTGCTGPQFTAPSSPGSYTYCAAIDKNEDGDTLDAGERSTTTLTVTRSLTASSSTCQHNKQATGLITAPNPVTGTFGNPTQQCILDPKAAFVPFKIPSYDELKSIFYDQSKSASKVSTPITATALPRPFTSDQIYHATGDINISDSDRPIGTGVVVIFVDGNLNITTERINYPTTSPNGGLVFVVKGKVNISANTKQINAIIIAEGGIPSSNYYSICTSFDIASSTCPTAFTPNSQQLVINGSLISLNSDYPIRFGRQLAANALNPAEKIIYQPKYLVLLKDLFSETLKVWKEIQ